MTRLPGSTPHTKYGSRAVCACGHLREWHWMRETLPPRPGRCKDVGCDCEQYHKAYDSQAEAARGAELELLERAGQIWNLRRQVRYPLTVRGYQIAEYVADFVYNLDNSGATVVEDVKGHATREYRMKRKLMLAIHGIAIQEYEA